MRGRPNPTDAIVAHFGGQNGLARALHTSQGTIWRWTQNGRVPSDQIPKVIEAAAQLQPPVLLEPNDFFAVKAPQSQAAD